MARCHINRHAPYKLFEWPFAQWSPKTVISKRNLLPYKLPGVDVDKNGNIQAQGESVQRVLVNGKRFFVDDPKMATQNLPPE